MLRAYQQRLVDETIDYLKRKGTSPLVVAPTGSGKTHVLAHLVKRFRELVPDARVLLLSHRKELLEQNLRTLKIVSPDDHWGVCCAGLSRNDTTDDLLIASVQSVWRRAELVAPRHLVLIDEAHLLGSHEDSMYGQLLKVLRERLPKLRLVGLTATPFRLLGGSLLNTGVFDGVASEVRVRDLIDHGYLSPLVSKGSRKVRLDTRSLKKRGGDFIESEMERLYDQQSVTEGAIDEMLTEGADRHHWLVFCCSVAHAEHVTERLKARGVQAACVHSGTPPILRAQYLEDFRSGKLRCLVNMEVLTTGFDSPNVDLVACLRPTASLGLWCLDMETEVLTREGWKLESQMKTTDTIGTIDKETGEVLWSPVVAKIKRRLRKAEMWANYSSRSLNFRVTSTHRMLLKQRRTQCVGYEEKTAEELSRQKSMYYLPCAGDELVNDCALTNSELAFLGWFHSDGCYDKSSGAIHISQATHKSEQIESIENALKGCGFRYSVRYRMGNTNFNATAPLARYSISRGMPRRKEERHLTGWKRLEPFVDKTNCEWLNLLSKRQLGVFLDTFNRGNGSKPRTITWVKRSYDIATPRKQFADTLQSVCVRRGYLCNVAKQRRLYVLHIKPGVMRAIGGSNCNDRASIKIEPPNTLDSCWCVQTENGTLITRRRGYVTIMGNCQIVGRGLRIAPGKKDCKILDFAGNCERLGAIDNVTYHRKRTYDADNLRIVETLEPKAAPITVCPSCVGIFEGRLVVCPVCKEEIRTNLRHAPTASEASVLTDTTPRELPVVEVRYLEHHKRGASEGTPPTFRVSYVTQRMPLEQVSEYLGFESPKRYAHMIAARWWQEHGGQDPVPQTVAEALGRTGELATVCKVTVRKESNDGKYYDRVISWRGFELPTAHDLINIY